jgi:uncharacterized protein YqgV (UPF0045/DUF77 family)
MAKAPKTEAEKFPVKAAVTGSNSTVEVNFDDLMEFLTDMTDKAKATASANGTLRSRLKNYLDNSGLHPKSVAIIRQLHAMNITQRQDVLRSLNPLLEVMDSKIWIDEQSEIDFNADETK